MAGELHRRIEGRTVSLAGDPALLDLADSAIRTFNEARRDLAEARLELAYLALRPRGSRPWWSGSLPRDPAPGAQISDSR